MELLDAREERVAFRRAFLTAHPGRTVVCLTVNMPGPVKRTPEADRVHAAGREALSGAFESAGFGVEERVTRCKPSGAETFFALEAEAEAVKRAACELEAALPYGRLLDADVYGPGGEAVSRQGLGLPQRGCLVCGRPGPDCARSRAHGLTELLERVRVLAASAPEGEL